MNGEKGSKNYEPQMKRDYMTIGSAPHDEECAQVGEEGFFERCYRECGAYMRQLQRMFPPPEKVRYHVIPRHHDFGTYYEVVIAFDADDATENDYAHRVEANGPAEWDEDAKRELNL